MTNLITKISISGDSYEIPSSSISDLKAAIGMYYLKLKTKDITQTSFFWGIIYLFTFLFSKDLIILSLALYFLIYAIVSFGKFSPKYFLAHSIVIICIAILNVASVITLNWSAGSKVFWILFAIYQLYYSILVFFLYRRTKHHKPEKIATDNFLAVKNLYGAMRQAKPSTDSKLVQIGYGLGQSRIIKILLLDDIAISYNSVSKKLQVLEKNEFTLEKKGKVNFVKKYKVVLRQSKKRINGTIRIDEFENLQSWQA